MKIFNSDKYELFENRIYPFIYIYKNTWLGLKFKYAFNKNYYKYKLNKKTNNWEIIEK